MNTFLSPGAAGNSEPIPKASDNLKRVERYNTCGTRLCRYVDSRYRTTKRCATRYTCHTVAFYTRARASSTAAAIVAPVTLHPLAVVGAPLPEGVTDVVAFPVVSLGVAKTSSTASCSPIGGAKGAWGSGGSGGGGGGGSVMVGSSDWGAWGVPVMS